jgi:hypothetical protein
MLSQNSTHSSRWTFDVPLSDYELQMERPVCKDARPF